MTDDLVADCPRESRQAQAILQWMMVEKLVDFMGGNVR